MPRGVFSMAKEAIERRLCVFGWIIGRRTDGGVCFGYDGRGKMIGNDLFNETREICSACCFCRIVLTRYIYEDSYEIIKFLLFNFIAIIYYYIG